jgi:hypothetical protein
MDAGAVLMIAIGLALLALAVVYATGFERRDRARPRRLQSSVHRFLGRIQRDAEFERGDASVAEAEQD